jgi:protein TonB
LAPGRASAPRDSERPAAAGLGLLAEPDTLPAALPSNGAAQQPARANDLSAYRLELARAARQFRRYPSAARARGVAGTAEIRVGAVSLPRSLATSVPVATVSRGSGSELLDAAALAMVEQAIAVAQIPPGLAGRSFKLYLPIEFTLDE